MYVKICGLTKKEWCMENFIFEYPTKVIFGKGAVNNNLEVELNKYGKNVMLAYGGGSIKSNGIYDEVMAILEKKW